MLFSDDRAEHVPGCNMAFWKLVLSEIGGFDPVYTKAGDDVDVCWKVLNRDWKIGFHPAALVWHRRRQGLRNYLRQQREYGRSEALVEDRHPERFTPAGTARWRGRIYNSLTPSFMWQRIYRGAVRDRRLPVRVPGRRALRRPGPPGRRSRARRCCCSPRRWR